MMSSDWPVAAPPLIFMMCVMMMSFMDCKIISWNIRGAVNPRSKRHVKELVCKYRLEVFIILETHTQFNNIKSFWENLGFLAIGIIEANGHAGGVGLLVVGNSFQVTVVDIFHQCVSMRLSMGTQTWTCSPVYASPIPTVREILCSNLEEFCSSVQDL